ncbi:Lrp/AsnC family transcriptional regulator [Rhodovulum sp. 12E13]|uniref:Lrp/AsnC family transcriptional regulator n=1 Tax=Rhodovulum sp. 12E13 TaxID=2203891 RepID=UPI000E165023|nr:Lrp/AsnC family transcriptional regulator [Rhodovulum sp. 12E13]RDC72512.1 Lrp/AsnC family transcriptional regulator [Rhodovulum sp. 12E13]
MDETDEAILAALAADSSTPTAELARRLGLARSTVQARIERLERSGVIGGYTIRLGTRARRGRIRATVLLSVEPRAAAQVLARLKPMTEVDSCQTSTGRVDLILTVAAEDTERLDAVLDRIGAIPGVTDTESLIHLATKFDRRL